jgi:ABC-type multidrug transport system ATPase subunit
MKSYVSSLPLKLSELVSEGGDNLSLGQRQLCCIARALLRKPKLLLLDEATASIDNETDELIQHMIKERFKGCTVLTIAHRLGTVIDADRIMVFHDGELVEMDTPSNLLNNPENASECTAGGEGGGGRGDESMTSSGGGTVNKSVGVFKGLWEAHEKNLMNSPNTRSSNATRLSSTGTVLES